MLGCVVGEVNKDLIVRDGWIKVNRHLQEMRTEEKAGISKWKYRLIKNYISQDICEAHSGIKALITLMMITITKKHKDLNHNLICDGYKGNGEANKHN